MGNTPPTMPDRYGGGGRYGGGVGYRYRGPSERNYRRGGGRGYRGGRGGGDRHGGGGGRGYWGGRGRGRGGGYNDRGGYRRGDGGGYNDRGGGGGGGYNNGGGGRGRVDDICDYYLLRDTSQVEFYTQLRRGGKMFKDQARFFANATDEQVSTMDPKTGLYPFMLAAVAGKSDLLAVYYLLCRNPGLTYRREGRGGGEDSDHKC